jgi:hypothetical protein
MNITNAKTIGGKYGIYSVLLGLTIAYFLMTLLCWDETLIRSLLWIKGFDYYSNVLIGILVMSITGYYIGQLAGLLILIKKHNRIFVGICSGLVVLFVTAFLSGWKGYFEEGLKYNYGYNSPFNDYVLNPFLSISIVGLIPSILLGIWLGNKIKKKE